jgi:hypothetical protein
MDCSVSRLRPLTCRGTSIGIAPIHGPMQLVAMATTSPQVLEELADILAAGLQRLSDRKSSRKMHGVAETLLDCSALSGGHVRKRTEDLTP